MSSKKNEKKVNGRRLSQENAYFYGRMYEFPKNHRLTAISAEPISATYPE